MSNSRDDLKVTFFQKPRPKLIRQDAVKELPRKINADPAPGLEDEPKTKPILKRSPHIEETKGLKLK